MRTVPYWKAGTHDQATDKQIALLRKLMKENNLYMRYHSYHMKYGVSRGMAAAIIGVLLNTETDAQLRMFKHLTTTRREARITTDDLRENGYKYEFGVSHAPSKPIEPHVEKVLPAVSRLDPPKHSTSLTKAEKDWNQRNLLEHRELYSR